jgi:hypothetical protein
MHQTLQNFSQNKICQKTSPNLTPKFLKPFIFLLFFFPSPASSLSSSTPLFPCLFFFFFFFLFLFWGFRLSEVEDGGSRGEGGGCGRVWRGQQVDSQALTPAPAPAPTLTLTLDAHKSTSKTNLSWRTVVDSHCRALPATSPDASSVVVRFQAILLCNR